MEIVHGLRDPIDVVNRLENTSKNILVWLSIVAVHANNGAHWNSVALAKHAVTNLLDHDHTVA